MTITRERKKYRVIYKDYFSRKITVLGDNSRIKRSMQALFPEVKNTL